jgi:hypothetical protein
VQKLEMQYSAQIVVSHVPSEQMKAQGTDGMSRGQMKEGVSAGLDMMPFIPFHKSALERSPSMREWITLWLGEGALFLEPKDALGGKKDAQGFWRSNFKAGRMVWMLPLEQQMWP